MKKLLTVLLALLVLVGCGGGGETSTGEETTVESDVWQYQNENVRKAMLFAIDREALAKSLNDGSVAAEGQIPIALASNPETGADYRDDAGKIVEYDLAKAQEYYAKACEELGKDSITINLLHGTNEGDSVIKAAEQIAYYLEEAGFTVNLVSKQKKERLALMTDGDYEVALTRWGPDYGDPQTFMDLYVSSNTANNSGLYISDVYDALVADAESGVDDLTRWQDWIDAEKQLVAEDAGVIPVFQAGSAMIVRPGVTGIQLHSAAVDNYRHLAGKDEITVVTNTDVLSWDNCVATDGTSFIAQMMTVSGLMELDEAGNPVLDLAESYEVSEDGMTYTFKIRDDAYWNNGTPVTAADFDYGWSRLISEEIASEYSWWLETSSIESWEAVDDKTFVVKLSNPSGIFLKNLAFPCCFPINQEFCESCGDQYCTSADTILGCGPYVLDDWTSGYSYSYHLNENYWAYEDYVAAGAAKKVTFRVLEDTQTALMEYEAGNLDTVILSGEQVDANKGVDGYRTSLQGYLFYLSININHGH